MPALEAAPDCRRGIASAQHHLDHGQTLRVFLGHEFRSTSELRRAWRKHLGSRRWYPWRSLAAVSRLLLHGSLLFTPAFSRNRARSNEALKDLHTAQTIAISFNHCDR